MISQVTPKTAFMPSSVPTPSAQTASRQFQREIVALIPHLRAFGRTLCHQHELSEDLAQETLMKAWRSRDRFEPGTNLKAWLFTILRNEYFSHSRRAWRQTHWDEFKGGNIAAPSNPQLWSLQVSDTANAMRELPDTQREAMVLVGAGGFSYEEAGKICGTPVGTVKSRVARGRVALMEILDGNRKIARSSEVRESGGSEDILGQLSALTPAGAHGAAYA
jgi:RNA polymerase sigma-70 factor, ECF subfamily